MTAGPPPPPPPGPAQGGAPPYPPGQPVYVHPGPYAPAPPTNPKAVVGLVAGLVWFCGVGSIVALACGYSAKSEIRRSQGQQSGSGIAVAAIVLGWIGLTPYVLFFALMTFGSMLDGLGA